MTRRFSLLYLLLALPLAACDDGFGPRDWTAVADTSVLHSLSRPEFLDEASAYDFANSVPRRVESAFTPGQWDMALLEEDGGFVFAPAGSFQGQTSRAAIATLTGTTLEAVERAPNDAEFVDTPIVLQTGVVYVVRSRIVGCDGFSGGGRYAKFEVLQLNAAEGWVQLRAITNPYCNDRRLIPPDSD